jgi:hypothetical protein
LQQVDGNTGGGQVGWVNDETQLKKREIEMFKQLKLMVVLAITATLMACASKEYYAVKNTCEPYAYNLFPPQIVSQLVTRSEMIDVPTGTTNCTSSTSLNGSVNTTCVAATTKQLRTYQQNEAVDMNSRRRREMVDICVEETCRKQYGNVACSNK